MIKLLLSNILIEIIVITLFFFLELHEKLRLVYPLNLKWSE